MGKLEHVFQTVNDLEATVGCQFAHITRVKETVLICNSHPDCQADVNFDLIIDPECLACLLRFMRLS